MARRSGAAVVFGASTEFDLMMSVLGFLYRIVNRFAPWHRLPFVLSVVNLVSLQHDLRRRNLHGTSRDGMKVPDPQDFDIRGCRMTDGSYNDLADPSMGMCGMRFGRNVPLKYTYGEKEPELLTPNPRVVSNVLLARKTFIPVPHLNLHVASWLQFMTHDWFNHGDADVGRVIDVPLPPGDDWAEEYSKPGTMGIRASLADPVTCPADEGMPATYRNQETHWWDGSQVYGSTKKRMAMLRSDPAGNLLPGGKLYLDGRGLLAMDPIEAGIELAGNNGNWWLGLSILTNLFIREHNMIADHLKVSYPRQSDEWIFQKARLVNAALMTKIHQVEWTPAILDQPVARYAQRGNWWGIVGEEYERAYGRDKHNERLQGIPGSTADHHTAPYSMTEEFIAVYRMHSLMPDEIAFRKLNGNQPVEVRDLQSCAGVHTREILDKISLADAYYTFGIANPGALTLHNFPNSLRRFRNQDITTQVIDLGSIDIFRDRERGVPRFCEMRRQLRMPVPRSFEEITGGNVETAAELAQVYDHVEDVDLLVGTLAEPFPAGFGFSDTSFRLFIVMATRRIKSDRFYTDDFNDTTYTPEGMRWIVDNGFASVVARHYPELRHKVSRVRNPFFPWPLD